jgi:Fic family protein
MFEKIKFVYKEFIKSLNPTEIKVLERDFDVNYIHSTTATEGNTCTFAEVTRILEDSLSPKGKSLREVYEVRNFEEVLFYRKNFKKDLTRGFILKLHELAMRDIDEFTLGVFRRIEVAIRGSNFKPIPAIFVEEEIEKLIEWFQNYKNKMHPVEIALRCHVRFEEIHPFTDGNGRVGREIFNHIVSRAGYPSLNFDISKRDEYLDSLELANSGDYESIAHYIIENYLAQTKVRLENNILKKILI